MGYGSIAGIPSVSPQPAAIASPHVPTIASSVNIEDERSPLVIRRRRGNRRSLTQDAVLNWKIFFLLSILVGGIFIGFHLLELEYKEWPVNYPFHLIDRNFWYGGEPIDTASLTPLNSSQVHNVVLFHTRSDFCYSFRTCLLVIRELHKSKLFDLPFNFLIGGDGKTYELRGWNYASGFEALPFNEEALTVGLVGDFTFVEPTTIQMKELEALIAESVRRKFLQKNYKLHGARLHERDGHKLFLKFKEYPGFVGWI